MGSSQYDQTRGRKKGKRRERKPSSPVSWMDLNPEMLRTALTVVANSGGCLRFGYTRDQGAYAIGVYGEGDPYTEYYHSVDDCTAFLWDLIQDYGDDTDMERVVSSKA